MGCDGCVHELEDRTKEPCQPCMASVLNGGERINYEAVPKTTYTVTVFFEGTDCNGYKRYEDYTGVYSHRFTLDDWLYIENESKYYIKLDKVTKVQITEE